MDSHRSGSSWRSGLTRLGGSRVVLREPVESHAEAVAVSLAEAGATRKGILRQPLKRSGGRYTDQTLWSMFRDDWPPSSSSNERRAD